MKTISLTKGMEVMVDDEDFEFLSKFKWHFQECKEGRTVGYAARWIRKRRGKKGRAALFMHRAILGLINPKIIGEHKDGFGLNNQKENLRVATQSQNRCNSTKLSNNKTGAKGVCKNTNSATFRASIFLGGKYLWRKSFKTVEEAIVAREEVVNRLHGDFALP